MFEKLREKALSKVLAAIQKCALGQYSMRGLPGRFLTLEDALAISERTVRSGFEFDERNLIDYLKLYPGLLNEFSGRNRRLSEILGESIMQKIEAGLRLEIEPMVLAQWSDWSCGDLLHDVDHAIKEMIEPDGGMVDHKLLRTVDGFRSKPTTEKARELAAELDIAAGNFQENYRPKIDSEMRRGSRRLHEASTLAYLVGTRGRADFFIEGAA